MVPEIIQPPSHFRISDSGVGHVLRLTKSDFFLNPVNIRISLFWRSFRVKLYSLVNKDVALYLFVVLFLLRSS